MYTTRLLSRRAPFFTTLLTALALAAGAQAQQVTVAPDPVCQGGDLTIQWDPTSLPSGLSPNSIYLFKGNSTGSLIASFLSPFATSIVWDVPSSHAPDDDYYIQVVYTGFTDNGPDSRRLTSPYFEIIDCQSGGLNPGDYLAQIIEDFEMQLYREYWFGRGPRPPWGPWCLSCPYQVDMLGLHLLLDAAKMDEAVNVRVRDSRKKVFADYGTLKPTGHGFQGLPRHTIVKPPQGLKRGKNCGFTLEVNDLKNQNIASTDICLVGSP